MCMAGALHMLYRRLSLRDRLAAFSDNHSVATLYTLNFSHRFSSAYCLT
jgi:hypothetical protein